MKNKMVIRYQLEAIEKAIATINDYNILEINLNELYTFSKKEKYNLRKVQELFSKVKLLRDHQTVELEHFSDEEALDKANSFLIELFPKKAKEILELDSLIEFRNINIYETGVTYKLSKNKVMLGQILLPTDSTNYTTSIIVHEKTHALTFNNIDLRTLFINGNELLPILLQKIVLEKLEDPYSIILDQIVRINDAKAAFYHIEFAKYLKTNPSKTKLDECMINYYNLAGHNYIISELYANLLMLDYFNNPETMIKKLNLVLSNKLSIIDFLESYEISLTNSKLIPTIKENTNKCKRISIIP